MTTAPAYPPPSYERLPDVEVVVVGGGPGGSAVAGCLAAAGHDVLLLDKARFPRHKACSEYVNPEAVRILDRLGAGEAVRARGPHRFNRMVVHAPGGGRFTADFSCVEEGLFALGLSRYRLDEALLGHAESQGVAIQQGSHVRAVVCESERAVGVETTVDGRRETIRARLVVGADGRHSVVARSLGQARTMPLLRQTGLVAHYQGVGGLADHGELHVYRDGYAGLAPLEDGLTNVALVLGTDAVTSRPGPLERFFEDELTLIPLVAERLHGAKRVGTIRGVGPMAHRARRSAGDGFLLVGDAAGFLDPFTGEGIYDALKAAQLAAPVAATALRSRDTSAAALEPYLRARRRAFFAKRQVCWIVQAFVHSPVLMDFVTRRLDRRDDVARTLTGVLGDVRPAWQALSPAFLGRLLLP
ncbi:MAG TPA: NAD(P)/FAD-dependent oxidoreductase [Thermomicrobiales bacterium]|nr:NAD(P)/FAD-dependent oxidoreductase [Thermomicrobiales bacterium]